MNFYIAAIDRLVVHSKALMNQALHRGTRTQSSIPSHQASVAARVPAHRYATQPVLQGGNVQCMRKPLRVIRVVDQGNPRTSVGRIVMSGSMAEICAELDRLAANEAGALTH